MTYRTIVVDPPWPQKGSGSASGGNTWADYVTGPSKPMPFETMPVADIAALPVADIAAPEAHLYLWTTNGFLADAFAVLKAWGFRYSTTLVWAKTPMGGGLGGCYGISTEFCLFARRGTLPALSKVPRTWFNWPRQHRPHSRKPNDFFAMVETVSPAPRLELFARGSRPGWDAWGDEAETPIEWAAG